MIHCQSAPLSQPEATVIVDQGMLKVSEMVKSISFHMQGQRVPGRKEKYMFIPNASTQCEKHYIMGHWRTVDCRWEPGRRFQEPRGTGIGEPFVVKLSIYPGISEMPSQIEMWSFSIGFQGLFEFAILQFLSITLQTPLSILTSGSSSSIFIACQRHPSVKCEDGYDYDWRAPRG